MISGALEDNVLTALCWDASICHEVSLRVTPDLFSTRAYRRIAKEAVEYLQKYNKPPRVHIKDLLEERLQRGEEGTLLMDTLNAMERLQAELQPRYVLESLDTFINIRRLSQAIEKASDALQEGKLEEAREAIAVAPHTQSVSNGIWLSDTKAMLGFMDRGEDEFFPTGVSVLDDAGIRPQRKALHLFLAPKGKGKSWSLINIGKNCMMQRKKVLHITLEMPEQQVAGRYVQALFGMSTKQVSTVRIARFAKDDFGRCSAIDFDNINPKRVHADNRKEVERKLGAFKQRTPLLIKEFPTGTLTIAQLTAFLDTLERQGFVPDIILLDHLINMSLDRKNMRVDLGRVTIELRGLAGARNIAMATATQGNRLSNSAKNVRSDMVGEDWSIIGTADFVVTYSQTAKEKKIGLARLSVEHGRTEEDGFTCLISQSYTIGQFCLDSVYMSNTVSSEVGKLTGDTDDGDG